MDRITAVFNDRSQAEQAVSELRRLGIADTHLSFVSKNDTDAENMMGQDVGEGAGRGLAVGATAGALFGIAAALIPGVGPFITAGALATTLGSVAGGAVAGAVVGGTTGTLAGAFADAGYKKDEAEYYERSVNDGHVLVAVDVAEGTQQTQIREVLTRYGGNTYAAPAV
ncbi:general stress protein [Deinococcus roseus]|uniref:General stress protein 17M-like domain-containing protein n=1 Tax=Deinococcus roseus TaxID=392414 RepID=A0ABQ2CXH7_9DEIO|nr:general stress protein [Deinococcus roseus]GGJ26808.1 hypothetical protein GCM10008938_11150 [Deinococcus roseus]